MGSSILRAQRVEPAPSTAGTSKPSLSSEALDGSTAVCIIRYHAIRPLPGDQKCLKISSLLCRGRRPMAPGELQRLTAMNPTPPCDMRHCRALLIGAAQLDRSRRRHADRHGILHRSERGICDGETCRFRSSGSDVPGGKFRWACLHADEWALGFSTHLEFRGPPNRRLGLRCAS